MNLQKKGVSGANLTEEDLKFEECREIEAQLNAIAERNAKKEDDRIKALEEFIVNLDKKLKEQGIDEDYFRREKQRMEELALERELHEMEIDEMLQEE